MRTESDTTLTLLVCNLQNTLNDRDIRINEKYREALNVQSNIIQLLFLMLFARDQAPSSYSQETIETLYCAFFYVTPGIPDIINGLRTVIHDNQHILMPKRCRQIMPDATHVTETILYHLPKPSYLRPPAYKDAITPPTPLL